MAKPRVFISSTFYDLKQVRSDIDNFIENLGYEPIRNEEGEIPYGKDEALEEYCYNEIKSVDVLISIIGGRFGSESKRSSSSISHTELKTAIKENKQVYIFIEKNVLSEYETYLLNKDIDTKYRYVDDKRIYQFVEEVKNLSSNNNIKGFETASDITKYLKEQFAGLFQRFLEQQTRQKEISLIRNLEKTAQTLNRLVSFLSEENKGQADEINKILMINHPLVETLRTMLEIPYNFYIEGMNDLQQLLIARGFKNNDPPPWDDDDSVSFWVKTSNKKVWTLSISDSIFDEEKRLKYIKKADWKDDYATISEMDELEDDDLPF